MVWGYRNVHPVLIPNPAVFFLRKPVWRAALAAIQLGQAEYALSNSVPRAASVSRNGVFTSGCLLFPYISTHLIRHNKNNIGLLLFHTLLHVPGDSHVPYILPCYADIAVIQNQLTEHGICPGEPLSGVVCRIIDVKPRASCACRHRYFSWCSGSPAFLPLSCWSDPGSPEQYARYQQLGVLAAYTLCTAAFIIIRICTAEHKINGCFPQPDGSSAS